MESFWWYHDQMIAYIFAVNIESITVATFRTTKDGMKITNISTYRQIFLIKLINKQVEWIVAVLII